MCVDKGFVWHGILHMLMNTVHKSRAFCAQASLLSGSALQVSRVVFLLSVSWAGPSGHCSVCAGQHGTRQGLAQCHWAYSEQSKTWKPSLLMLENPSGT